MTEVTAFRSAPRDPAPPTAFARSLVRAAVDWHAEAEALAARFLASDYLEVFAALRVLRATHDTFEEWGAGLGVVTALAHSLGYQATGIELEPRLVDLGGALLSSFGVPGSCLIAGDLFEEPAKASLVFAYPWPGEEAAIRAHFMTHHQPGQALLLYLGTDELVLVDP